MFVLSSYGEEGGFVASRDGDEAFGCMRGNYRGRGGVLLFLLMVLKSRFCFLLSSGGWFVKVRLTPPITWRFDILGSKKSVAYV